MRLESCHSIFYVLFLQIEQGDISDVNGWACLDDFKVERVRAHGVAG